MAERFSTSSASGESPAFSPAGETILQLMAADNAARVDVLARVDSSANWEVVAQLDRVSNKFVRVPQFPQLKLSVNRNTAGSVLTVNSVSQAGAEFGGSIYPVNVLSDIHGNFVNFDTPALVGGQFSTSLSAKVAGTTVYAEYGKFGQAYGSLIDDYSGQKVRSYVLSGTYAWFAGGASDNAIGTFSNDALLGVLAYNVSYDAVKGGYRKMALPSESYRLNKSIAGDNAKLIRNSAGMLGERLFYYNKSAVTVFLKLYDKGSSAPVVGDSVAFWIPLKPSLGEAIQLGNFIFQNGLGYRLTTDPADTGTAGVAADDVGFSFNYSR